MNLISVQVGGVMAVFLMATDCSPQTISVFTMRGPQLKAIVSHTDLQARQLTAADQGKTRTHSRLLLGTTRMRQDGEPIRTAGGLMAVLVPMP